MIIYKICFLKNKVVDDKTIENELRKRIKEFCGNIEFQITVDKQIARISSINEVTVKACLILCGTINNLPCRVIQI